MKKAISCFLVVAAACWVATFQVAQAEIVPWSNSFETNTVNIPITNNSDFGSWTGTDDTSATVTNIGSYQAEIQAPVVTYPLNSDTHSNVVVFNSAGLTNAVVGEVKTNVWVDMMIQPVQTDGEPPVSDAIANSQMSMYVNTSGYICVYHAILTNDTMNVYTPDRFGWTTLEDFGPIETGKWIRVTVQTDYTRGLDTSKSFFRLTVNNHVFSNAVAFLKEDDPNWTGNAYDYTNANLNGSWFMCANDGGFKINGVAFSGTGKFDDLVVTDTAPSIDYVTLLPKITATAGSGGSIEPSGIVELDTNPGSTNFMITANTYFHIASVVTNGQPIAGLTLTGNETATNLTLAGISASITLDVTFAPDLAGPNGTPQWWLAQYTNVAPTLSITDDAGDFDLDGAFNWQEFVAGTIPINSNSVLKIVGGQVLGNTGTVVWPGTTNMPDTNAVSYVVQATTNLVDGTWITLPGKVARIEGLLTNSASTVVSPGFFRVSFTNE
jgi:hypothetical protein